MIVNSALDSLQLVWDLLSLEAKPGMLSMLAGKPNPSTFPFDHITVGIKNPAASFDSASSTTEITLNDAELAEALQYGPTAGMPALVEWLMKLTEEVHCTRQPSQKQGGEGGWRVSLGSGSQDLLYKVFYALLNPGDTIIVEGPTYP